MDVQLFQTADDGDVEITNGVVRMTRGIDTAVYVSLFGGNEDDAGIAATEDLQFWGNFDEPIQERRLRSQTQALLRSLPLVPANLRRIEDAAAADLAWLKDTGVATFVVSRATMPALNTVKLTVSVEVNGTLYTYTFQAAPDRIPKAVNFAGSGAGEDDDAPTGPPRTLFLSINRRVQTQNGHVLVN